MRLKLILFTSILAAMFGAGAALVLGRVVNGYWGGFISDEPFDNRYLNIVLGLAPLFLSTLMAGIFVYRHTAHRRKTQAELTAILVLVFASLLRYLTAWLLPPPPLL